MKVSVGTLMNHQAFGNVDLNDMPLHAIDESRHEPDSTKELRLNQIIANALEPAFDDFKLLLRDSNNFLCDIINTENNDAIAGISHCGKFIRHAVPVRGNDPIVSITKILQLEGRIFTQPDSVHQLHRAVKHLYPLT